MLRKITAENSLVSEFPALRLVKTGRLVRIAGKLTFITMMLAVAAAFLVPWRQTARGTGTVLALDPQQRPQVVRCTNKGGGIVAKVKDDLREGSFVVKGEELIVLAPFAADAVNQAQTQVETVEAKKKLAADSLKLAKENATAQVESGQNMLLSLDEEYKAAQQKLEQVRRDADVLQAELVDKENQLRISVKLAAPEVGVETTEALVTKQQAVAQVKGKMAKAARVIQEAENMLLSKELEIKSKSQEIDIKNQTAAQKVLEEEQKIQSIEKELSEVVNKQSELRLPIYAPRTGYIQQWNGLVGSDVVKEGEALFVLVPETDDLSVELQVNGNDIPLVREGDPVRLQFEGWPAVQLVGWPSAAVGTFGGKVNRISPTDNGKGIFTIVITPDHHFASEKDWPDRRYLRQGVRANGWVLLNEVPLGFEIWRQLNGFPPVIPEGEQGEKQEKEPKIKLPK